jgi:hypothetical protein
MTDPKVEERARKLLKPHVFRVGQRRADLGGIRVDSAAVDYWEAVHVVADLLTKLDEASTAHEESERQFAAKSDEILALLTKLDEAERQRYLWQGTNAETLAVNSGLRVKLAAAEERERVLIAGVKELAERMDDLVSDTDRNDFDRGQGNVAEYVRHALSRLLNPDDCGNCWACLDAASISPIGYVLCPDCGNKRCPKASDHKLDCTRSNASGQPGSVYTARPSTPTEEGKK